MKQPEPLKQIEFWALAADGWVPPMFTYIVQCGDSLKFGKSKDPESRVANMQTGNPVQLKIVWCWPEDIEDEMHAYFDKRRVRGEWFDVPLDEAIRVAAWLSKRKCRQAMASR